MGSEEKPRAAATIGASPWVFGRRGKLLLMLLLLKLFVLSSRGRRDLRFAVETPYNTLKGT